MLSLLRLSNGVVVVFRVPGAVSAFFLMTSAVLGPLGPPPPRFSVRTADSSSGICRRSGSVLSPLPRFSISSEEVRRWKRANNKMAFLHTSSQKHSGFFYPVTFVKCINCNQECHCWTMHFKVRLSYVVFTHMSRQLCKVTHSFSSFTL